MFSKKICFYYRMPRKTKRNPCKNKRKQYSDENITLKQLETKNRYLKAAKFYTDPRI